MLLADITNSENPVDEAQARNLRKLSPDDLDYFQNEFCHVVIWFIESITRGQTKVIKQDNFGTLLDLTYDESGYDKMKLMEEKAP